jgi:nitroimidazol reductase NimA-like FMN-containing flavoprotein (pyridoxamine 5'-phosphate oxidase superfamily)
VGRVVVSVSASSTVFPVPMALDGEDVVFAVPHGSDQDRAVSGALVALEADVLDRLDGWSVVVTGRAVPIPDGVPLPAGEWPPGSRLWRLPTDVVSGRRLSTPAIYVGGSVPVGMASVVNRHGEQGPSGGYGTGAERISVAECLALLKSEEVGRLALVVDERPAIFPVNYTLDGDTVVFRTAPGTKLAGISRSIATFEVDRWDAAEHTGWTVTVEGFAVEVSGVNTAELYDRMAALPLFPWAPGEHPNLVRIMPVAVSGSRWSPPG